MARHATVNTIPVAPLTPPPERQLVLSPSALYPADPHNSGYAQSPALDSTSDVFHSPDSHSLQGRPWWIMMPMPGFEWNHSFESAPLSALESLSRSDPATSESSSLEVTSVHTAASDQRVRHLVPFLLRVPHRPRI